MNIKIAALFLMNCLALVAESSINKNPQDNEELLTIHTPNKLQKSLTSWFGVPTNQLTPKNLSIAALPLLLDRIETSYLSRISRFEKSHYAILSGLFIAKKFLKINRPSAIPKLISLLAEPTPILLFCQYLKNESLKNALLFFCTSLNLYIILQDMISRYRITKIINELEIGTYSRQIPPNMVDKKYFILDSQTNNCIKKHRVLLQVIHTFLGRLNERFPNDYYFSIFQLNNYIEKFSNKTDCFSSYNDLIAKTLLGHEKNSWHGNYKTTTLATTTSYIPLTLPVTQRLFILKNDAKEQLSTAEYKTLKGLCYDDYLFSTNKMLQITHAKQIFANTYNRLIRLP
ncbi:hypothetical protein FJ366_01855 [Candidatus Dependentiae bacterium]|nr:hypothetical protein [Candidatus Dependentiae bacterium]